MNSAMIKNLVLKDWTFNRIPIFIFIMTGLASLVAIRFGEQTAVYVGMVLIIVAVMSVGGQLVFTTIINERKEQTLPFIMSLPVSSIEYTVAKFIANVLIFFAAWVVLLLGSMFVITDRIFIPNGLIPYAILVLTELFAAFTLYLTVALITESEGWTVFALVVSNLFLNYFLFVVARMPAIANHMEGPIPVWNSTALGILALEALFIVSTLGIAFFFQARKRDFL
jgi:hypothetical protein